MKMPPIDMIGAVISIVQVSCTKQLDLLDVVGGAGQQRRGAEPRRLLRREAGHVAEDRRAQIASDAHAGARPEVHRADGADHLQRR